MGATFDPIAMTACPTPRQILEALLPPLRLAAGYARHIQGKIQAQPEKTHAVNPFAAALTDADLSVQTFVEVALLGLFPEVRFYGEEYEKSYNTKYFRAIDLGEDGDYLVTLDPIDGTRFYMDGHPNYQIIVTVLNRDDYEGVLALSPALNQYYYALRGQGTYWGELEVGFDQCDRLQIPPSDRVFLGTKLAPLKPYLSDRYTVISISEDYSPTDAVPTVNGILNGGVAGVVLAVGQFIDGAALAFLAREAGHRVTTLTGNPLPPLHQCHDYKTPGLIMAATPDIQRDLLAAVQRAGLVP
jgi:fructose-1,6-bisphosphatase/inositol monophosphatase family enzyme